VCARARARARVRVIKKILDNAKLPVSSLQIELHVYFQQNELVSILSYLMNFDLY